MTKILEKFTYDYNAQAALDRAKKFADKLLDTPNSDIEEGLYIIHAPREQAYYVENGPAMIRYNLGEEIIWSMD